MTDRVAMHSPLGGNQSHRGKAADADRQCQEMADDGTRGEDYGVPIGEQLSSLWLFTQRSSRRPHTQSENNADNGVEST
jgi:hypothetical protein